jgi:hypothetical protein
MYVSWPDGPGHPVGFAVRLRQRNAGVSVSLNQARACVHAAKKGRSLPKSISASPCPSSRLRRDLLRPGSCRAVRPPRVRPAKPQRNCLQARVYLGVDGPYGRSLHVGPDDDIAVPANQRDRLTLESGRKRFRERAVPHQQSVVPPVARILNTGTPT